MLLDPETLELAPIAPDLITRIGDDGPFKLELPASQLEIVTPAMSDVGSLGSALLEGRRELCARADGAALFASAGVHPFSPGIGALNRVERYEHTIAEYAEIASRQLVCACQVHVSVGDADRTLAVYNHARSYLPLLAALAANAPFYEGRDTRLASVRPKLSEMLPRQGVPPPITSWEDYEEILQWGARTGTFETPRTWWWELRPHTGFGTLEFRVPDGQSSVRDAIAIAALTQALVAWLGARHEAGERLEVAPSWQIDENRWSACRHGVDGGMVDLQSGERRPTSEYLLDLVESLMETARGLGSIEQLVDVRRLVDANGAIAQRRVAAADGTRGVASWLVQRFLATSSG